MTTKMNWIAHQSSAKWAQGSAWVLICRVRESLLMLCLLY